MSEKVDNRPSLFFITCFQKIDTDKLGWLDMGDSRVFGFKETFEQADSALKRLMPISMNMTMQAQPRKIFKQK